MAVPTVGSFSIFGTESNTTIAGAIAGAGFSVSGVDNFGDLIGAADITLFDPAYAGVIENPNDVTSTQQFRNFPLYDSTLVVSGSYTTTPFYYAYTIIGPAGSGESTSGAACAKTSSLANYAVILSDSSTVEGIGVGDIVYGVDNSLNIITFVGANKWYGVVNGPLGSYPNVALQINNGGYILAVANCLPTSRIWTASGGSLIYPRYVLTSFGTATAAVAVGGDPYHEKSEEYNGSTWSASNNLIRPRNVLAGAGEQNAGIVFGGLGSPNGSARTEEYNGTTWSAGGELTQYRYANAGAGTQNAALTFGGFAGNTPVGYLACTEEYNGTSWSSGGALINARWCLTGGGTQNAALAVGGENPAVSFASICTEEYNGTSWSTQSTPFVSKISSGYAGTQNAGIASGGSNGLTCSEEYNGTSWTIAAALPFKLTKHGSNGTQSAAIAVGGKICCYDCYNSNITFHYG